MQLTLKLPTPADEAALLAYKADFLQHGDSMDGTAGLKDAPNFTAWYTAWQQNLCEETVRAGLVPATTFLAVDATGALVGMIDVRHRLNDHLLQFGGHIGYSVLRAHRCKGAATQMLSLALQECRALGMQRVLITCNKENIPSAKTILNNGGVLENEVPDGARITQRYWVVL